MTFQNAATTVAAFILYFVRKVLEKAGGKKFWRKNKKALKPFDFKAFSHGGDKRDRTAELLRNAAKAASGGKILIKTIQVVSGTKAGKKKKDRSKSCLFYMVEISGIEPLTS